MLLSSLVSWPLHRIQKLTFSAFGNSVLTAVPNVQLDPIDSKLTHLSVSDIYSNTVVESVVALAASSKALISLTLRSHQDAENISCGRSLALLAAVRWPHLAELTLHLFFLDATLLFRCLLDCAPESLIALDVCLAELAVQQVNSALTRFHQLQRVSIVTQQLAGKQHFSPPRRKRKLQKGKTGSLKETAPAEAIASPVPAVPTISVNLHELVLGAADDFTFTDLSFPHLTELTAVGSQFRVTSWDALVAACPSLRRLTITYSCPVDFWDPPARKGYASGLRVIQFGSISEVPSPWFINREKAVKFMQEFQRLKRVAFTKGVGKEEREWLDKMQRAAAERVRPATGTRLETVLWNSTCE